MILQRKTISRNTVIGEKSQSNNLKMVEVFHFLASYLEALGAGVIFLTKGSLFALLKNAFPGMNMGKYS